MNAGQEDHRCAMESALLGMENLEEESRASWEEGDMPVKAQTRVNTVYLEVQDLSGRR